MVVHSLSSNGSGVVVRHVQEGSHQQARQGGRPGHSQLRGEGEGRGREGERWSERGRWGGRRLGRGGKERREGEEQWKRLGGDKMWKQGQQREEGSLLVHTHTHTPMDSLSV